MLKFQLIAQSLVKYNAKCDLKEKRLKKRLFMAK